MCPVRTCIECGNVKELIAKVRSQRCHSCVSSKPRLSTLNKKTKAGYKMIVREGKGNRVYLHRYIMEQYLGRKLSRNEHVHHIDGNRSNNKLENLELLTATEHALEHLEHRRTCKKNR